MSSFKKILAVTLGAPAAVLLTIVGAYLLVDDSTLVAYLSKKIGSAAGITIRYTGVPTVSRTLTPTLRVAELAIEDHGEGFRFETDSLEVQVNLSKLIFGHLDIPRAHFGNTQFKILQGVSDSEKPTETGTSSLPLKPAIHDLQIAKLSVTGTGDQVPPAEFDGVKLQLETHPTTGHFTGSLSIHKLSLPELLPTADKTRQTKSTAPVFSRTPFSLDWLNKVNLDLTIDIESFGAKTAQLRSAHIGLVMDGNGLTLDPVRLVYPKGTLDLKIKVDTRDTARLSVKAHGQDLDPWQALNIQQSSTDLKTAVNIDIAIDSTGDSPHDLAGNAKGKISIIMRDGKLRRSLTDLLFIDLVGWTFRQVTAEKFVDVSCGLADFSIHKGVVTTNAFFLETENIAIGGDGTIDLGKERIDYVLLPRKKTALVGTADPITIRGALNDPTILTLPWKSAAKTYGQLVFAPYIFVPAKILGGLFGKRKHDEEPSPCIEYIEAHGLR